MRAMNSGTGTSSLPADAKPHPEGLPRFSYLPPVIATTLAAIFIFLSMGALAFFGLLNTITGFGRLINSEEGASLFGTGLCGIFTLMVLVGTAYFGWVTVKGFRDIVTPPHYTRGTVMSRRNEDREAMGRKAYNWLLLEPEYMGPNLAIASAIDDDQRAASVDRAAIFNPRFTPAPTARRGSLVDPIKGEQAAGSASKGGYLSPGRISSSSQSDPEPAAEDRTRGPQAVFRVDFASKARFAPDEEILVAHSRFLEHVYYVARLRDGEWEVWRNRGLL